ncbi:FtsX-like permease family protein [Pengzhenrongella sicca]|uniref:ABC3 transporter permease C-terminal domain-containing protein n=1 Tax=Pengzhenrongella sicca TaxID=2819238 RepID=A0A8A4ZJ25_9MICO|nr:FtsX-like permease family protein [Pengzhenrongella sicca]QTE30969.1 hypothetical protein J4E96_08610 [Pengzhenrongella sicca]
MADRRPRRAAFVLQRAATQPGLLAAVLAIVVAGTALLGTCALLLTTAQDQVLATAMRTAAPDDVKVTAAVHVTPAGVDGGPDSAQVVTDTVGTVVAALRPFASTTSTWASSEMLFLPTQNGVRRYGYLEDGDGLEESSRVIDGRWPAPAPAGQPLEVAVLGSTAQDLGLELGSTTVLSTTSEQAAGSLPAADAGTTRSVVVVGIITPAQGATDTWARDPLEGAGFDPFSERLPVYGPFIVAPGTLLATGVGLDLVTVVARPDLSDPDPPALERVGAALSAARADVRSALGDRAKSATVYSAFPATLAVARTQQGVTGSGAVAVALLGAGLAGTALGLAARLVVGRRAAETALLAARGASRAQLARHATVEALTVALLGAAVAIPLTLALYRAVLTLPQLARAELAALSAPTPALVLTVAVSAAVLAAILVAPTLRSPMRSGARRRVAGLVARSGADLLLAGIAVLGFLQLRAHRVATTAQLDPVLVAAPVLCLLAGAALVLRLLPVIARLAEVHASRSRALTVPLAGWELARRPHATSGAFLLVLAAAAATFGLSFTQTWSVSQQDQADVEIGTDLAVGAVDAVPLAQGRALADATGATPAAVTARPIGLGSRAGGGPTGVTRLVALDTTRAQELLRGRLPADQGWAHLTEGLAPTEPPGGALLPAGDVLTLSISGASTDGTPLVAAPTLVLQDSWGDRATVDVPAVPLDGQPHIVRVPLGLDDGPRVDSALRLVAVDLDLNLGDGVEVSPDVEVSSDVTVAVQVLDGVSDAGAGPSPWISALAADAYEIKNVEATQTADPAGVVVTATATLSLTSLLYTSADLVVTSFASAGDLPVAVSADLAASMNLAAGDILSLSVDAVTLRAVVLRVVPYVPSAARSPGVLADNDALSRAVLGQGDLSSLTDAWWVGDAPRPEAAAEAVRAAHLGEPVTRVGVATDLREGALRAPLRVAIWLLVAAAVVLSLAGTAVHTAGSLEARSVDVARLQGLGVPRRSVIGSFLLEHGVVSLLAVAAGAVVGALIAWAAGPLLVVSATGLPPIPDPRFVWPWLAQGALLAALLLGGALVAAPVAVRTVRRATIAHLRMDAS